MRASFSCGRLSPSPRMERAWRGSRKSTQSGRPGPWSCSPRSCSSGNRCRKTMIYRRRQRRIAESAWPSPSFHSCNSQMLRSQPLARAVYHPLRPQRLRAHAVQHTPSSKSTSHTSVAIINTLAPGNHCATSDCHLHGCCCTISSLFDLDGAAVAPARDTHDTYERSTYCIDAGFIRSN